jgi:hypothetical protein
MGKQTQLSRVEVAPLVAEIAAETFSDVRQPLYKKIRKGVHERFFSNDLSAAIGLDLMDCPYHHARQIKEEI